MPKTAKYLLIGSTEAYCGKSATILGMAHQLMQKGIDIAYGKPLGTCLDHSGDVQVDEDVRFVSQILKLPENRLQPTLLFLNEDVTYQRLRGEQCHDYRELLQLHRQPTGAQLVILEGPGNLEEGRLFDLSLPQVAEAVNANVLLVSRFQSVLSVDKLLCAKQQLGDRLIGVVINDIPAEQINAAQTIVRPFLESQGLPILAMLPSSALLRSVSVGELVRQLKAEVLCRPDRLDLMVETLTIGAMNVNLAMKYFSQGRNMAVVTGGDRTDIQMAALETYTQCLILTGHTSPAPWVLNRAEEVEVPVLSVDLDTLKTVEIIEHTLGQVRLHEPIKVEYMRQLMSEHFDVDRLLAQLELEPAVPVS